LSYQSIQPVIQVSEILQNRNIVLHEKVTHGERAMSADG
jgi:hypothetical protein